MTHFNDTTIYHIHQFADALNELDHPDWLVDQLTLNFQSELLCNLALMDTLGRQMYIEARYNAIDAAKKNSTVYQRLVCYHNYRDYLDTLTGSISRIAEQFDIGSTLTN